jgi:hypothetical protein
MKGCDFYLTCRFICLHADKLAEHLGMLEQAVLLALIRPQTELGKEGTAAPSSRKSSTA